MDKSPWIINATREVYENPWIQLTEFDVINPGGGAGIYGKVHFKNRAIGIVALDELNNVFLVGQFRFPINQYSWELPEGGGPFDEDPLLAAKRELLEETGLKASNWQQLMRLHLSNSVTDEDALVFLATNLSQHQAEPEETEDLQCKKIPFNLVVDQIMKGEITDSITVAAILKLKVLGY